MKNELGRKITSLTIMTIMLAGGMTIAAPSFMPEVEAQSTALMYVSCANDDFDNTFAGGQICEIIVRDPARGATDEAQPEPTVEVNDEIVRMVQGADGYWYAYIAETTGVSNVHGGASATNNLDYGVVQTKGIGPAVGVAHGVDQQADGKLAVSAATTVYIAPTARGAAGLGYSVLDAAPTLSDYGAGVNNSCTSTQCSADPTDSDSLSVTGTFIGHHGQLNVTHAVWPFIQTFSWSDIGSVDVTYEKPGAHEVVSLNFEGVGDGADGVASLVLDRNAGPAGAEIAMTINDPQLNIDPTVEDTVKFHFNTTAGVSYNHSLPFDALPTGDFGDNGVLAITVDANSAGADVVDTHDTIDYKVGNTSRTYRDADANDETLIFWETSANSGVFTNVDDADVASTFVSTSALRGTTATFNYNDDSQSYQVVTASGSIDMVESDAGDTWNSGEEITVVLVDPDMNLNTNSDEDLTISAGHQVPTMIFGSPLSPTDIADQTNYTQTVNDLSKIAEVIFKVGHEYATGDGCADASPAANCLTHQDRDTVEWDITTGISWSAANTMNTSAVHRYISLDVSDICKADTVNIGAKTDQINKGVISMGTTAFTADDADFTCEAASKTWAEGDTATYAVDIMAIGADDNHAVYRVEVEETGDNTGVFEGTLEFIMLNQNTINNVLASSIATSSDAPIFALSADYTGTDAPRLKYNDTDGDGVWTPIADQVDAPTHSGTVDFDVDNGKIADTITVTVDDADLNTDSGLIDVYVVQDGNDKVDNTATDGDWGLSDDTHVLDITIGGVNWYDDCDDSYGLKASGFQLTETGLDSGVFTGTFQVPENYCSDASTSASATGKDIEVAYIDFRDAGGNQIEVGDSASISANTGSVSLDRSVYPVPYDYATWKDHADVYLPQGNTTITIAVTDPDYDVNPVGEDTIAWSLQGSDSKDGLVTLKLVRGATTATIASNFSLVETSPSSGVFEYEVSLNGTSWAALSSLTPDSPAQGDVLTVEYEDQSDAAGTVYLVTDSSTLDLRTGSLLSDKSVYVIGSDMILTLVEPDLNRDSGSVESYPLNLVEWDSDAGTDNLGSSDTSFDPEPSLFRETGEDTGIFQVVIEIPATVTSSNVSVDQGEKVELEYVDNGPSGEAKYGDDTEDIGLVIYTSNFGATIELDSKVYSWTDRVFITIVAPDHNRDTAKVDEIGGSGKTLTAQTRDSKLTAYKMAETGPDTGIFYGEITLDGFSHDADGDGTNEHQTTNFAAGQAGPTNGYLKASESDGITVSFEYTDDSTVVSSSLIRWNMGETSFSEDAYLSSGTAVVTVTDPDMNQNADSVENFKVDVYSDSDSGGIELTVSETNESTGIFEGTVFFTTTDASGGHTLRVSEGDSITADYSDHTLPEPYSTSDDIDISATAVIGTQTPPLERAPVANARVVDAFGNSLAEVSVDQQVQIEADLVNGQDGDQSFAYLVQVQNSDGVTVSLAWITGQLAAGQSFSPALSWIPDASGSYEATVFVWESVDNPTALSDTTSVNITVV